LTNRSVLLNENWFLRDPYTNIPLVLCCETWSTDQSDNFRLNASNKGTIKRWLTLQRYLGVKFLNLQRDIIIPQKLNFPPRWSRSNSCTSIKIDQCAGRRRPPMWERIIEKGSRHRNLTMLRNWPDPGQETKNYTHSFFCVFWNKRDVSDRTGGIIWSSYAQRIQ